MGESFVIEAEANCASIKSKEGLEMSFSAEKVKSLGYVGPDGKLSEKGIKMLSVLLDLVPPLPNIPKELFVPILSKSVPVAIECVLIRDGRIFLTPRDDKYFGKGWHMPGTYLVPREKIRQAIQRCLDREIPGLKVRGFELLPGVDHPNSLRFHDFSAPVVVDFEGESEKDSGEWFDKFPEDLIPEHKDIANVIAPRLRGR